MKKNPTPVLPLPGEGVEAETVVCHRTAPPPEKGEAGRGLKPKLHNLRPQKNIRRQHGIGHYVVDFYCAEYALIVEIDGDSHYAPEAIAYDNARTKCF